MKKLKQLPIGVQTFKKMRELDYVYIDKTEFVYNLAMKEGVFFLSRPRRFGKSLLLSTFKELFKGNRPLFKDLWIEDKWDWSVTKPVIHLSFASMSYRELGLAAAIKIELKSLIETYKIDTNADSYQEQFKDLIEQLYQQFGKVVILIDEYDKPIIDYLEKGTIAQAKENQAIMKTFYSVLKDAEDYIQFLFITGVSKFSKVSIFSDLNHLDDLTLHQDYATIVGYTQEELELNFEDHIQNVMQSLNFSREKLLAEMKKWYDGFSWDGRQELYNPFGTLSFFNNRAFRNYWFATGTPTFLLKLMKEKGIFEYESKRVNDTILEKYDLDNLDIVPIMFQTGYLTVKEMDFETGDMLLDYPNQEVRDSTYQFIIDDLSRTPSGETSHITVKDLSKAFNDNDLATVQLIINTLFSDVPVQLYEADKDDKKRELELSERFFHSIIHLLFKYLGIFIDSEVSTSLGRADSVVQTPTHIYLFEFKYNRSANAAMTQLENKNYADKYRATGKKLIGIGVNFSHKIRRINGWKVKELN
jgi:hypothetical protein